MEKQAALSEKEEKHIFLLTSVQNGCWAFSRLQLEKAPTGPQVVQEPFHLDLSQLLLAECSVPSSHGKPCCDLWKKDPEMNA